MRTLVFPLLTSAIPAIVRFCSYCCIVGPLLTYDMLSWSLAPLRLERWGYSMHALFFSSYSGTTYSGTAYCGNCIQRKALFFPHTAETAYSEGVGVCNVAMRPSLQSGGIRPASYLGQVFAASSRVCGVSLKIRMRSLAF